MSDSKHRQAPPLLEVNELSLSFRQQRQAAVDRASFQVRKGSTLGLVGASGAGKSTAARAILRLVEPESGEILFNGEDILKMGRSQLATVRQQIQIVFQDPSASLSPRRTIGQTLAEPLDHFAIGKAGDRRQKIHQVLETVGLEKDVMRRFPHQFSSGQQQRIAIARALVSGPELLIADEAVSSLDVSIQAQILQLLRTLQERHGVSILFISHDLAVIRQIADDVAVIYRGQVLERSGADAFFAGAAHPYSQSLLYYAKAGSPGESLQINWRPGRRAYEPDEPVGCVFSENCPDRMPLCESVEPAVSVIRGKNRPAAAPHCVKCHLYDETNAYDH